MENVSQTMLRLDWPVDQYGYEIIEAKGIGIRSGDEEMLSIIKGKGGPLRYFRPLDNQLPIHRDLASLDETEEAALGFCRMYGVLTQELIPDESVRRTPSGSIRLMSRGPGLVSASFETLNIEYFWWMQNCVKSVVGSLDAGRKEQAISEFNTAQVSVTPQIEFRERRLNHHWHLVPHDLISAIWLLVEREITGGTQWRRCRTCQTWFAPRTKRATYCRDACKTAWNRRQKKEKAND